MASPNHRGDVFVTTRARDGQEPEKLRLALTLGALEEIEAETGHPSFIQALAAMGGTEPDGTVRHPSAKAIGAVVRACIRAGENDLDDTEIANLPLDLADVLEAIGKLAGSISPDGEGDVKSKARPQRRTGRAGS